jgi:hypothetical protein
VRLLRTCPNLTKLTIGPRRETRKKTVVNQEIESALTALSRLAVFESSFDFSPQQIANVLNACVLTRVKFCYVIKPGLLFHLVLEFEKGNRGRVALFLILTA